MAVNLRSFTPVADLDRRREAEAQLKARLAPGDPGDEIKNAGLAFMKNGRDTPASLARKHTAMVNFRERDAERLAGVKQQLYKEQADQRNTALGIAGDMGRQQLAGQQQFRLAKFGAENERGLQELRGAQQLQRTQLGAAAKDRGKEKGALTTKDRFGIRKGLLTEFYGDNPAGEALRKKYGDNGFGMFATQMEQRYQPKQTGPAALPQPAVSDPSYGTITRDGQVIAASTGGLPTNPEAFATQLKQGGQPQPQPETLQPTGMVRATLPPSPQPLDDEEFSIPEEFTTADRIPGVSRELPQRTKNIISLSRDVGRKLAGPVRKRRDETTTERMKRMRKSFVRRSPY